MPLPSVIVNKTVVSLGGSPSTQDGITLFVFNPPSAYTTSGTLVFNSLRAVEQAGITEAKDLANNVLVWEQLKDFYTQAESEEAHVLFVPEACTYTNLFTFANANNTLLRNYLASKEGRIKMLAVSLKPTGTETNTGLSTDLVTSIPLAQVVADDEFAKQRPLDAIVLEGRALTGTASAAQNLRGLASGNVAVMVGRDATRRAELTTAGNTGAANYADIGKLMGRLARIHVGRSCGRVNDPAFIIVPEFSGGQKPYGSAGIDFTEADLALLNSKGYIFFRTHPQTTGAFLVEDSTCSAQNLSNAYIRYNRIVGKAARIAIATYTSILLDEYAVSGSGKLLEADVVRIEATLKEAIYREMINNPNPNRAQEISNAVPKLRDTTNVLATQSITVDLQITPVMALRTIDVNIQLVNPA